MLKPKGQWATQYWEKPHELIGPLAEQMILDCRIRHSQLPQDAIGYEKRQKPIIHVISTDRELMSVDIKRCYSQIMNLWGFPSTINAFTIDLDNRPIVVPQIETYFEEDNFGLSTIDAEYLYKRASTSIVDMSKYVFPSSYYAIRNGVIGTMNALVYSAFMFGAVNIKVDAAQFRYTYQAEAWRLYLEQAGIETHPPAIKVESKQFSNITRWYTFNKESLKVYFFEEKGCHARREKSEFFTTEPEFEYWV